MDNFQFCPLEKFWTEEKFQWLAVYPDFSCKDLCAKDELTRLFNLKFDSDRSSDAIYKRFRKLHPRTPKTKSVVRLGKSKTSRIRCRRGSPGIKLNGD
jgi:hypothetical protein